MTFCLLTHRKRNKSRFSRRPICNIRQCLPGTRRTRSIICTMNVRMFYRFIRAFRPPNVAIFFRSVPIMNKRTPILSIRKRIIKQYANLSIRIRMIKLFPNFRAITTSTSKGITFRRCTINTHVLHNNGRLPIRIRLSMVVSNCIQVINKIQPTRYLCLLNVMNNVLKPLTRVQNLMNVARMTRSNV